MPGKRDIGGSFEIKDTTTEYRDEEIVKAVSFYFDFSLYPTINMQFIDRWSM